MNVFPTVNFFPHLAFFVVLFIFIFLIEVQLIYSIVLVSGVQQSDSVIHTYISILFQILFPHRLLQNTEQSSLCYIVGPCWLSILYIVVCICQSQTPSLSLTPVVVSKYALFIYFCRIKVLLVAVMETSSGSLKNGKGNY